MTHAAIRRRSLLWGVTPSTPPGLDLRPWARRWGLMVLGQWLERELHLPLF